MKNMMSKGVLSESKLYNKVEHAKKGTVATITEEIKLNGSIAIITQTKTLELKRINKFFWML